MQAAPSAISHGHNSQNKTDKEVEQLTHSMPLVWWPQWGWGCSQPASSTPQIHVLRYAQGCLPRTAFWVLPASLH